MTLRRSASGLRSIHIFFRVDLVVYCEGGQSVDFQEATALAHTDGTLDTFYWASVARLAATPKRCHFKSVGSKTTLSQILREVEENRLTNIAVCVDSDYDGLLGTRLQGGRVAHTLGYSWESDVVRADVVDALMCDFIGPHQDALALRASMRQSLADFGQSLVKWTEMDIALSKKGNGCLFDRKKHLSCVDVGNLPSLREEAIKRRLGDLGYKRGPKKIVSINPVDVLLVTFGKMVSRVAYKMFVQIVTGAIGQFQLSYDVFMRLAVSKAISIVNAGGLNEFCQHIRAQRIAFL